MQTHKSPTLEHAYSVGGAREKFAMDNGRLTIFFLRGEKCYRFTYSKDLDYQDANGATYNTVTKTWID